MAKSRVVRSADIAGNTAHLVQDCAPLVSGHLAELLTPYLEAGETLPDIDLLQKLIGRLLADRQRELDAKDQQTHQSTGYAGLYRAQRNQAVKELREVLRSVRFFLDSTLGRGEGAKAGIGTGLSTMAPFQLLRTGEQIALLLAEPKMDFASKPSAMQVATLAAQVSEKTRNLEEILQRLTSEQGKELHYRASRQRSTDAAEKTLRRTAALLAGLYKFVNHDRLAKAVRPSFRRRKKAKPPAEMPALPPEPVLAEVVRPEEGESARILPPGLESRLPLLLGLRPTPAELRGLARGERAADYRDEEDRDPR